jgi:DNA-binding CsgD family transcriptional regulator
MPSTKRELKELKLGQPLTSMEIADLQLAAFGYDQSQSAKLRGVSYHSIKWSRQGAFGKLGTDDITHAVAVGVRRGDIFLPDVETHSPDIDGRIDRAIKWTKAMELLVKKALVQLPPERSRSRDIAV